MFEAFKMKYNPGMTLTCKLNGNTYTGKVDGYLEYNGTFYVLIQVRDSDGGDRFYFPEDAIL